MRLGKNFHRLVERAETGIDHALLARGLESPIDEWFENYGRHRPTHLPAAHVEIERVLNTQFELDSGVDGQSTQHYGLSAKYDLIAANDATADGPRRVVIVDWKTSRRRTDPAILAQRWQTYLYMYIAVEASAALPWGPVEPEDVEMCYWFTADPVHPVTFHYDRIQHENTRARLTNLIGAIVTGSSADEFPKIPDTDSNRRRYCNFCVYRSRCNRGVAAGSIEDVSDLDLLFTPDETGEFDISLDEVAVIQF